jgi:hypothetical protein
LASLLFSLRAKLVTFAVQISMGGKVKSVINFKLGIASAYVAFAVISGGCALMEPKYERYVAPPIGSTWVTARRDTGSYGSGSVQIASTMGEQMWQGQKLNAYQGAEQTLLARDDGRWVAFVKGTTPLITYDPPVGWQHPLEVGKVGTQKFSMTIHAAKRTIPIESTYTVEGYEEITVPAGTFKTYRVRSIDNAGNENLNWFSPELGLFVKSTLRRTAKHAQGPGTREQELVSQTVRR